MDVNGCHIVSVLDSSSPDGFAAVVSRYVGYREIKDLAPDAVKVSKGPFYRQAEAVAYAHSWTDAENPPAMAPHEPLDVNGCSLVTVVDADAPDGISTTVTRQIIVPATIDPEAAPGTPIPEPTTTDVNRGPFAFLKDAVAYAKIWNDAAFPPPLPVAKVADAATDPPKESPTNSLN